MASVGGETTACLLTPSAVGAMAVVRLVGPAADRAVQAVFVARNSSPVEQWAAGRLVFGRIVEPSDGETIDEAIVARRLDLRLGCVVDITVHGGVRVAQRVIQTLERQGCTIVGHAEAIVDPTIEEEAAAALACAKTERAVRFIARQRVGLPQELSAIVRLTKTDPVAGRIRLKHLLDVSKPAKFLVEGACVAFAGPANAGKSTLMNRLFDRSRSLVSPTAGTTRDWVDVEASLHGVPVRAIDTAGQRESADELEREAMARGVAKFREADVQIIVLDRAGQCPEDFLRLMEPSLHLDRAIVAINKSDLSATWEQAAVRGLGLSIVETCGLNGAGVEDLGRQIVRTLAVDSVESSPAAFFTGRQGCEVSRLVSDVADEELAGAVETLFHLRDGQRTAEK